MGATSRRLSDEVALAHPCHAGHLELEGHLDIVLPLVDPRRGYSRWRQAVWSLRLHGLGVRSWTDGPRSGLLRHSGTEAGNFNEVVDSESAWLCEPSGVHAECNEDSVGQVGMADDRATDQGQLHALAQSRIVRTVVDGPAVESRYIAEARTHHGRSRKT